jgi:hypothetical protein
VELDPLSNPGIFRSIGIVDAVIARNLSVFLFRVYYRQTVQTVGLH